MAYKHVLQNLCLTKLYQNFGRQDMTHIFYNDIHASIACFLLFSGTNDPPGRSLCDKFWLYLSSYFSFEYTNTFWYLNKCLMGICYQTS